MAKIKLGLQPYGQEPVILAVASFGDFQHQNMISGAEYWRYCRVDHWTGSEYVHLFIEDGDGMSVKEVLAYWEKLPPEIAMLIETRRMQHGKSYRDPQGHPRFFLLFGTLQRGALVFQHFSDGPIETVEIEEFKTFKPH